MKGTGFPLKVTISNELALNQGSTAVGDKAGSDAIAYTLRSCTILCNSENLGHMPAFMFRGSGGMKSWFLFEEV